MPSACLKFISFSRFWKKRHSQIKEYQEVALLYSKNGNRCVALLHMQVMGTMIASLIERSLHLAMKKHNIKTLPIYPEDRACKAPTMFDIDKVIQKR